MGQAIQPEHTKVKTQHTITYKGRVVKIIGEHEYRYAPVSKMEFGLYHENMGLIHSPKSKLSLREKLDEFIVKLDKEKARLEKSKAFKDAHSNLTVAEKIAHANFAYSRFQKSEFGNYYNIYWKSELSPTGIELVGGCTEREWEDASKESGNSHNYLSPTEGRTVKN